MRAGDTIAAVATPPGLAPRGIVRCSGPEVAQALAAVGADWSLGRGAHRVRLGLAGATLPALAAFMPGPRSFTGEDCAELVLPGAPIVVDRVLDALVARGGARLAAPGEFSARAYLAGRLTVEQAEGVAMAIGARSAAELDAARRLLSGESGERWRAVADELAGALALVEAGIDFTDQEDVVAITPAALLDRLEAVTAALGGVGAAPAQGAEPVIVLAGAPSAGKSTLFNALLGRRRAVVDESPGTTRDALREPIRLGDGPLATEATLVDLAGLDGALVGGADGAAQDAARRAIGDADVVLWCDPAGRFDAGELPPTEATILRVRTKADLPGAPVAGVLGVCALDRWNLDALRRAMRDGVEASGARGAEALIVLPRHREALSRAVSALDEAIALVAPVRAEPRLPDAELIAGAMRAALDAIGEVSGRIDPDDVIGRIFASFCVGK